MKQWLIIVIVFVALLIVILLLTSKKKISIQTIPELQPIGGSTSGTGGSGATVPEAEEPVSVIGKSAFAIKDWIKVWNSNYSDVVKLAAKNEYCGTIRGDNPGYMYDARNTGNQVVHFLKDDVYFR